MIFSRSRLAKAGATVTTVGVLAGGVAFAATSTGPPAPPPAAPEQQNAAAITAVDRDQEATLGVLRRAVGRTDAPGDGARSLIAQGSGPALGANPALARLALTTALGEKLYVVPARGWVCLTSDTSAGNCTPTDRIAEGYAVGLQPIPSGYRLRGLVPDGVKDVTVHGAGSESATATPEANAWQADVAFTPATVSWTGAAGEKTVPVVPPRTAIAASAEQGPVAPGA
jgi:hypothetical protein